VRYGELKRRLRRLGIQLEERRKRHELWRNPQNSRYTLIPRHDQQEVPRGILHAILADLGISADEL
jgi:predicted RNA binding protein YcfA (HicA-like mRNA interferase family)